MNSADITSITIEVVLLILQMVGAGWTAYSIYDCMLKKCRPAEEKEVFNGDYALMIEEIYRIVKEQEQTKGDSVVIDIARDVKDLRGFNDKTDNQGIPLAYTPRTMVDDVRDIRNELRGTHQHLANIESSQKENRNCPEKE